MAGSLFRDHFRLRWQGQWREGYRIGRSNRANQPEEDWAGRWRWPLSTISVSLRDQDRRQRDLRRVSTDSTALPGWIVDPPSLGTALLECCSSTCCHESH